MSPLLIGYPAINLAEMALQPEHRQYFKERPGNLTVIEGESITLRCEQSHGVRSILNLNEAGPRKNTHRCPF